MGTRGSIWKTLVLPGVTRKYKTKIFCSFTATVMMWSWLIPLSRKPSKKLESSMFSSSSSSKATFSTSSKSLSNFLLTQKTQNPRIPLNLHHVTLTNCQTLKRLQSQDYQHRTPRQPYFQLYILKIIHHLQIPSRHSNQPWRCQGNRSGKGQGSLPELWQGPSNTRKSLRNWNDATLPQLRH